jgi:hypothetical protein
MPLPSNAQRHWDDSKQVIRELHYLTGRLIEELPFAEQYFDELEPEDVEEAAANVTDLRLDLSNVKKTLLVTMAQFMGTGTNDLAQEARRAAQV